MSKAADKQRATNPEEQSSFQRREMGEAARQMSRTKIRINARPLLHLPHSFLAAASCLESLDPELARSGMKGVIQQIRARAARDESTAIGVNSVIMPASDLCLVFGKYLRSNGE